MSYLEAVANEDCRNMFAAVKGIRYTAQRGYVLRWIERNPGSSTATIDRYCRTAKGGHKWMYALVGRLQAAGLVTIGGPDVDNGRGAAVRITALGALLLEAHGH
jgi:hypothetical protein